MSNDLEQLPPLESELASLVAAERASTGGPDAAQRARLRTRLAASLVLPAAAAAATWSATATAAGAAPKVIAGTAAGWLVKPATIGLAVVLAAGAGVGIHRASRPPVEEVERAPLPATAAPTPVGAAAWAAERAVLEAARDALAGRQGARALDRLDEHARRFPTGLLAEEREALRVQVLVSLGRADQARAAASRFESAYPGSVHRDAIRRALQTRP